MRERQLLHRQCLHQYQRPRFEPAPVDTPEAGIGKPTDTTPVPDFVVEGMGEQLRRVREEDGLGVAVVAPVDFQLSRTGNGTLHTFFGGSVEPVMIPAASVRTTASGKVNVLG